MSYQKKEQLRRKNHNNVSKNIKKLFTQLKQDPEISRDSNHSIFNSEPCDLTIVIQNDSFTPELKRKSTESESVVPKKIRKSDNSLIVINDHNEAANDSCVLLSPPRTNSHINCSTPIAGRDNNSIQKLIINNFMTNNNESAISDNNKTKLINKDSYLTIDLTADTENKTTTENTVIDLDKLDNTNDCTVVSVSDSLSMSGESNVTVLQNKRTSKKRMKQFTNDIAQLNSSDKEKLLEMIAQKIFNGCDMKKSNAQLNRLKAQSTDTEEDAYIKEVILGESKAQKPAARISQNSIGSNIYHPSRDARNSTGLRMIIIDGSNVAMEHTKGKQFSVQGLKICIDYFLNRGHIVKAFVPRFRCKFGKSSDPRLLDSLERQGLVVYTPSREIKGKNCVPYDDRYIIQCAAEFDGVVVSGDNYRDLINENQRWRYIIENRILPFTWVHDMIMFPKDPFGRGGPTLETLLKHPTPSIGRNEPTNSLFNWNIV